MFTILFPTAYDFDTLKTDVLKRSPAAGNAYAVTLKANKTGKYKNKKIYSESCCHFYFLLPIK